MNGITPHTWMSHGTHMYQATSQIERRHLHLLNLNKHKLGEP